MDNSKRFIKLIRDRVGGDNDKVVYERVGSVLSKEDFHWMLKEKLNEEVYEYIENGSWDELIDVFEVIWTLTEMHNRGFFDLQIDAKRVRLEKGGFSNRMAMWIRREE